MAIAFVDNSAMSLASVFELSSSHADGSRLMSDEELILDARSGKRPYQMVEDRLMKLLKGDLPLVSQLRTRNLIASRS